jgi:hypothetical protein
MKKFVQSSLLLMLLLGCTTVPENPTGKSYDRPISLNEIKRQARRDIFQNCENDIFWARQPLYPFVDFTSYNWWINNGGTGLSPTQWCKKYAEWKVP